MRRAAQQSRWTRAGRDDGRSHPPFTRADAAAYAGLIGAASAIIAVASRLRPAPQGFGTHEQLGLPPCPFLRLAGWPCPGCGLTTSFAYMARLDLSAAFAAQPFGVYAFLLNLLLIPLGLTLLLRRVSWQAAFARREVRAALYLTAALFFAGWVSKLVAMS